MLLYSTGLLRDSPMNKLINQAKDQLMAAPSEHIVWVFAEKAARDAVEETFNDDDQLRGRIQLMNEPWRPGIGT